MMQREGCISRVCLNVGRTTTVHHGPCSVSVFLLLLLFEKVLLVSFRGATEKALKDASPAAQQALLPVRIGSGAPHQMFLAFRGAAAV